MMNKVSKLADKAVLVKLTIRRAALTRRDDGLTKQLQQQEGDASLTVLTKLFKDRSSPINQIMAKVNEVYQYHRLHTLPYVDAGPRILPNNSYFEYTADVKHLIAQSDSLLNTYMPHYAQLVHDDVMYRNAGHAAGRAKADDYPTDAQFKEAMSLDFRFMPMPDTRHFLFDLSEDDLQAVEAAEAEALALANADTVRRMLKPLEALVAKLDEYRGEKGQRFHNSVVENVIEGCKLARKLAIAGTPELMAEIDNLQNCAQGCLDSVETIKGSDSARSDARKRLAEASTRLSGYF